MAEKDKIKDLFTPSGCLSNQGLARYIEGNLDPEGQKLADLHISGCELCADAMNGYRHHAHTATAIHDLNRKVHLRFLKIHQRTRKERPMAPVFSVAATIILLAGIFLLLKQREMMTEKILAEARHDSAPAPVPRSLQPVAGPEGEFSSPSVKKLVAGKEKKHKEMAPSGALSIAKTEAVEYYEDIVMNDVAMVSDETENKTFEEEAIPEIMTDSVMIIGRIAGSVPQSSPSSRYAKAGRKSTPAKAETILNGQDDMQTAAEQKEEAYIIVEEMPAFMDGDISRFLRYIRENIAYPPSAAEAGIEGRVVVNFVVHETGKLADAKIIRSADPLIDAEALRVVSSSPLWKPGLQHGKPVKVSYTVPIVFSLQ